MHFTLCKLCQFIFVFCKPRHSALHFFKALNDLKCINVFPLQGMMTAMRAGITFSKHKYTMEKHVLLLRILVNVQASHVAMAKYAIFVKCYSVRPLQ